ncbi:MAG TPA: 5'/3'-nucleotidase SurE [Bacillota bacterium]|nr:5'/3'-nucleotidase SurE [Bacillota bacterium]HOB86802.1 5'/3'-nucleotidase SurE [Bacillota bacterium]HOP69041.1 5'/3'-nucleotidase SurE [Bacillota bacterium]HPT33673.1 5'/3'-nucleotidase SurE [Bacillota bacterium]HPZ64881.1 5'/3'-nucleotidase SurE [Bacillota bacterium]
MDLLVTNDDGIHAEGIQILCQVLFQNREYRLTIVAPDHERSAVGHAITMHRPLMVEKQRFLHNPELQGWAVNGTPSDCVKLAIEALLPRPPRMVIAGINRGSNLGNDVIYSGTVSAAVEGIILGVPAIAVSLTEGCTEDFFYAAEVVKQLLPQFLDYSFPPHTLLNINIPPRSKGEPRGVRVTRLGRRRYRNTFEERVDPRGRRYYWLAGELEDEKEHEESDVRAIQEHHISITPVKYDLTSYELIPELEKLWSGMTIKG